MLLIKQNLIILHWVNFLIRDWKKKKKEGLLKRLKNIKNKSEEQLKAIKNKTENTKEVTDFVEESLSPEIIALIN